jgi:hypothetical protein
LALPQTSVGPRRPTKVWNGRWASPRRGSTVRRTMGIPRRYRTRPEANNKHNKKLDEVFPLSGRFQKVPSYITVTTGPWVVSLLEIVNEG